MSERADEGNEPGSDAGPPDQDGAADEGGDAALADEGNAAGSDSGDGESGSSGTDSASGGAERPQSIDGMWSASDKSSTKTIQSNGSCTGMYYQSSGDTLDIGGPMMCTLSSKQDGDGAYTMQVEQPPNSTSYSVSFEDDDTMVLSTTSGTELVTLTRQ